MFSYFWICFASDLTDHSDSVPFNTERKWELCIIQCLGEHSFLSWIYSGLWCVCSTGSFSLEADVIISVGSACSPHSAASARGSALLGICSWSFVTSVVSGCKSQCWLQLVKTSSCFYLGALFRKRRALSVHRNITLAFQLLSIHLLQVPHQLHSGLREASESPGLMQSQQSTRVLQTSPTPQGTEGLAPQGTNSSETAAGISKKDLRDQGWSMWETWCHTVSQPSWLWGNLPLQAGAWVVSALEDFFFLPVFLLTVPGSYSVSCGVQDFNHIWLLFCPQKQTRWCLLKASNPQQENK